MILFLYLMRNSVMCHGRNFAIKYGFLYWQAGQANIMAKSASQNARRELPSPSKYAEKRGIVKLSKAPMASDALAMSRCR